MLGLLIVAGLLPMWLLEILNYKNYVKAREIKSLGRSEFQRYLQSEVIKDENVTSSLDYMSTADKATRLLEERYNTSASLLSKGRIVYLIILEISLLAIGTYFFVEGNIINSVFILMLILVTLLILRSFICSVRWLNKTIVLIREEVAPSNSSETTTI
jgi:hypothetical protein